MAVAPMHQAFMVDALTRPLDLAGGNRIERAARVYDDEFNKMVIVRVTRYSAGIADVARYCYFNKFVGTGGGTIEVNGIS